MIQTISEVLIEIGPIIRKVKLATIVNSYYTEV